MSDYTDRPVLVRYPFQDATDEALRRHYDEALTIAEPTLAWLVRFVSPRWTVRVAAKLADALRSHEVRSAP